MSQQQGRAADRSSASQACSHSCSEKQPGHEDQWPSPYPSAGPGHAGALNSGTGHTMQNMYNVATGGPPLSNNAITNPLFFSPTYLSGLSPAETHQQLEVSITDDSGPAPFATFEALVSLPRYRERCDICSGGGAYVVRCVAIGTLMFNNYSDFLEAAKLTVEAFLVPFVQITTDVNWDLLLYSKCAMALRILCFDSLTFGLNSGHQLHV